MAEEIELVVDGEALNRAMAARKMTVRMLADATSAENPQRDVTESTIRRWLKSPNPKSRPHPENLQIVAKVLGVDWQSLVLGNISSSGRADHVLRDCSGTWRVEGKDILVSGHFDYPDGPHDFVVEKMKLEQTDDIVEAVGTDDDNDPIHFRATLHELGTFLLGSYHIKNDRMHAYGAAFLEYLGCGKRMRGYYLGRDTGQGGTMILGEITATKIDDPSPEL